MGRIPDSVIDKVQAKLNIAEVIGRHIQLKKAGRNFKALCPFHHEKTPSFIVNPEKQIFHCFGCGAGGNLFGFIMKYNNLSFPEALRMLAEKAGVKLPEIKIDRTAVSRTSLLYRLNQAAADYFYNNLTRMPQGRRALSYLNSRGIKSELINKFRLGYALSSWDAFFKFARAKGYSEKAMEALGFIIPGKENTYYDRFRDRIIFPISDARGRVVGFGGRVLDNKNIPKYMNSPESEIYVKGRNLYGLDSAAAGIRSKGYVIVVEGYMDLLSLFQHGIDNAVASLGTALTIEQVRLMKRLSREAVIVFDADMAGQTAALRGLDLFIEEEVEVRVVGLPKDMDPDDYIRKKGRGGFYNIVTNAEKLFDYKISILEKQFDKNSVEGKARIAREMLPSILRVKNAILRAGYIKKLAEGLGINEGDLRQELKKVKLDYLYSDDSTAAEARPVNLDPAEKMLLELIIEDNSRMDEVRKNLRLDDFMDPRIKMLVGYMYRLYSEGRPIEPSKILNELKSGEMQFIVSEISSKCEMPQNRSRALEDCIGRIKKRRRIYEMERLKLKIKRAQDEKDEEKAMKLLSQCNELIKGGKI